MSLGPCSSCFVGGKIEVCLKHIHNNMQTFELMGSYVQLIMDILGPVKRLGSFHLDPQCGEAERLGSG